MAENKKYHVSRSPKTGETVRNTNVKCIEAKETDTNKIIIEKAFGKVDKNMFYDVVGCGC